MENDPLFNAIGDRAIEVLRDIVDKYEVHIEDENDPMAKMLVEVYIRGGQEAVTLLGERMLNEIQEKINNAMKEPVDLS